MSITYTRWTDLLKLALDPSQSEHTRLAAAEQFESVVNDEIDRQVKDHVPPDLVTGEDFEERVGHVIDRADFAEIVERHTDIDEIARRVGAELDLDEYVEEKDLPDFDDFVQGMDLEREVEDIVKRMDQEELVPMDELVDEITTRLKLDDFAEESQVDDLEAEVEVIAKAVGELRDVLATKSDSPPWAGRWDRLKKVAVWAWTGKAS